MIPLQTIFRILVDLWVDLVELGPNVSVDADQIKS